MADDALSLSPQDRDLMIRTVIGEANGDASAPAVAHVILNRARNNGQSVKDVVLAKGQFEPWSTRSSELLSYAPTDPAYKKAAQIVDAASTGAIPDPTNGATKFYAPKAQAALGRNPPKWDDGTGQQIGAHKFFGGSTPDLLGQWGNGAQPSQSAPAQDETPDILGSWQSAPSSPTQVPIAPTPAAAAAPGIVNLAANPNDTATDTAAKALGTTAIKGLSHVPGFLGDIADTADYLGARITSKIKGIPVEQAMAEHNARLNALANSNEPDTPLVRSYLAARSAIPSGQDIQNKVLGTNGAYQPTSTLGKYGMMAGEMGIGGGLLGAGALPSAAVGTAGNALAEATGEPLAALAVGAASPAVARIGGYGVRAAGNAIANTPPGARAIATHFGDIGITPAEAETRLTAMGPEAMPADIDPATTRLAGQLAARGGPAATSVLEGEMKQRSAGADERMHAAIEDALGPKPNAQEILGNIRQKEEDLAFDPKVARSVLNESMGEAQDPHAVLQTMLAKRSADAQPLYEKAMQGGSIAPLESQFQNAYGEATSATSQAEKSLAAAQQKQLLARAQESRAGENVYASNSASASNREADVAVKQAEASLASARNNEASILSRLRQAQSDGSANAPGAVWSPRIQQFLDDPITQAGIAKGVRIQRLESLAEGKPFNPTEYAITGMSEDGKPVVGSVPNMRTLNVAKKGLDSMVEDAKDPITGRLSEEGRAIDGVRKAFVSHLDEINPDYKAARAAWAGPTVTQEAFNRGLNIFRNQSGANGVNSTPGALYSWFKGASEGEKEAVKLGTRSAFEQQMSNASDPAAKATALANRESTQQKLASILGPDEAKTLIKKLSFRYEDPIGQAFGKGMDIFKQREGVPGIEDTPDALRSWQKTASPGEIEAHRQGARQAIEQAITSARQGDVSAARSLFAKSTANREKLDAIFPGAQKLFDKLDHEIAMRHTEQQVAQGSKTAATTAANKLIDSPGRQGLDPAIAILGEAAGGAPLSAGLTFGKYGLDALLSSRREAANALKNEQMARGLASRGSDQSEFLRQVARAHATSSAINALSRGTASLGGNYPGLLLRSPIGYGALPAVNALQHPAFATP